MSVLAELVFNIDESFDMGRDGKNQYEDNETKSFMMLPTDMALKEETSRYL